MKKYKINTTPKKPKEITEKDILKYKNFNSLMVNYNDITKRKKLPLYRNKKVFLFLILLALVAYLLYNQT